MGAGDGQMAVVLLDQRQYAMERCAAAQILNAYWVARAASDWVIDRPSTTFSSIGGPNYTFDPVC
jgi:hypothetical protein